MKSRLYVLYQLIERNRSWFASHFTDLGKIVLLTALVALFFGVSVQRTMIYQIFTLSFSLVLVGCLFTLKRPPSLKIRRKLPKTCIVDKELKYTIVVENSSSGVSRWSYCRERLSGELPSKKTFLSIPERGEARRNFFDKTMGYYRWKYHIRMSTRVEAADQQLPQLARGETAEVEMSLFPRRRGSVHIEGFTLGRLDPFGLCRREHDIASPDSLLVLPKLYPVGQLFFPGSRKYHQGGMSAALERGESNEFLTLREYQYGDPVKHIDWKASARTDKIIVKQHKDEYFSRYGLVLDSYSPQKWSMVFEEAVSLAASVLMAQDSVNTVLDLLFVERECVITSVGHGLAGKQHMLEILAAVETCDRGYDELAGLVKSHTPLLSGIFLILIDFNEDRNSLLSFLSSSGIPCRTVLLSENPEEARGLVAQYRPDVRVQVVDVSNMQEEVMQL